jgi:ankyrin repeat protein
VLVENGADVNVHIKGDDTPLINAVKKSSKELVDFLIRSGADVNQYGDKDRNGKRRTPLNQAELAGSIEIKMMLEQAGARYQR